MPRTFDWDNLDDIAIGLTDKYPDVDPLTVRFTDMHKWITELPGFAGDPLKSNESKLEAIQMAWHEEWEDRKKREKFSVISKANQPSRKQQFMPSTAVLRNLNLPVRTYDYRPAWRVERVSRILKKL